MKNLRVENQLALCILIFICLVALLVWAYHRYKYSKTNYNKFEYYLNGNPLQGFIIVTEIAIIAFAIIGGIYVGAKGLQYLIF